MSGTRICIKPRCCGRFPITYLPFPQSESNSPSICSGSRISTTATYAVCHQRANQYSRKSISQHIALRALWATQKLWKVVLKERRVNMINRTPLAKTGCSLLNMKYFAFPEKNKKSHIHIIIIRKLHYFLFTIQSQCSTIWGQTYYATSCAIQSIMYTFLCSNILLILSSIWSPRIFIAWLEIRKFWGKEHLLIK